MISIKEFRAIMILQRTINRGLNGKLSEHRGVGTKDAIIGLLRVVGERRESVCRVLRFSEGV